MIDKDKTEFLPASYAAMQLYDAVLIDYWSRGKSDYSDYHIKEAHKAFEKIAEVLGYKVDLMW